MISVTGNDVESVNGSLSLFREVWKHFVRYLRNRSLYLSVCVFCSVCLSGEVGFRAMFASLGWAKRPMVQRVNLLPPSMPVTMVYGSHSWVDSSTGSQVAQIRGPQSPTQVVVSLRKPSLHSNFPKTIHFLILKCYGCYLRDLDEEKKLNFVCFSQLIDEASHHVYADQPEEFNQVVENICRTVV